MRAVFVLAWVAVGIASASPARAADPVARLEQRVAQRGARSASREQVTVAKGRKLTVWVRPGAGVIGVTRGGLLGFREHGYFLGAGGTLSAPDRAELSALLARHAPKTTAASIDAALDAADAAQATRDRVLVAQDPRIGTMLAQIAAHRGPGELVLHTDRRGALSYRPTGNVLVARRAFGETGYFLTGDRTAVAAHSLDGLRAYLAERPAAR